MINSCLSYHHKSNIQLFHESIQLVPINQNNTINISRTALQDLNITDSVNCSVNHWMISLYLPPLGPSRASSPPPPPGGYRLCYLRIPGCWCNAHCPPSLSGRDTAEPRKSMTPKTIIGHHTEYNNTVNMYTGNFIFLSCLDCPNLKSLDLIHRRILWTRPKQSI